MKQMCAAGGSLKPITSAALIAARLAT